MTDLLGIGAQGVNAYRGALTIIGENVANADTAGYHRRDVRLTDTALIGAGGLGSRTQIVGGVRIASIARSADGYLDAEARLAFGEAAGATTAARWLNAAEGVLGAAAVPSALSAFHAAGQTLAGDPGSNTQRRQFLARLDDVAAAFRGSAEGLARASDTLAEEARAGVAAINADLRALANVNKALLRATPGSNAHAALLDERDRRLESLDAGIGVDVRFDVRGRATVSIPGAPPLLDGETTALLTVTTASDGRLSFALTDIDGDIAVQPRRGALAGLAQGALGIADARRGLDAAAVAFAGAINGWSAAGTDATGTAGAPLVAATGAAGLVALTSDPARVAAAAGGAANGNALALGDVRAAHGGDAATQAIADGIAQALSTTRAREGALTERAEQIAVARADVSGVDLDREAAELLRYQQAYDASSRVIQVARETIQSLLSIF